MVLNAGAAFLGLTVHCARCHDHKFDPISQRDYYAMTAIFAGVHHGERPLRTPDDEARKREAERLRPRLAELEAQLVRFEPLADPTPIETRPTDARLNVDTFDPVDAKFVRFTVHDANLHPTLGLIEPCIDELEIVSTDGRNVALATAGAKVTASGSVRGSDIHRLEHINDGKYGNGRSWMSDEKGRGWVLVELARGDAIDKVVWSRDREGVLADRLATAYSIEAGPSPDALKRVAGRPPLRPAVNPRLTVDRFAPAVAKRLRFTVLASTSLEPCLDELEVFTTGPGSQNVALAGAGATAKASSTLPGSDIHRLEHLNDGRYGNGRSWISGETGRGWVEVEFPQAATIDRVAWARDREGKFTDRLATDYRIEVDDGSGQWKLVASSRDRRQYVLGAPPGASYSAEGLGEAEAKELRRLLAEKRSLDARLEELTRATMAYAGIFSEPDETFRLHRGDPMQRREPVAPGALARLTPKLDLPADAPEQARRLALARCIADPENPLTARVLVNRLWHHHFGEGLVNTPSDLGNNGARPVNQELLDWLASEFVDRGWSIKAMQRLIVTSATFRQSSRPVAAAAAIDSGTRLLWRLPAVPGILSRRIDPRNSTVMVWGAVNSGTAANAIPQTGTLAGTIRTASRDTWETLESIVHEAVSSLLAPLNIEYTLQYRRGVPPVVNEEISTRIITHAIEAIGPDVLCDTRQSGGGEDFSWYLEEIPGAMARLGVWSGRGPQLDLHQPTFDIDERAMAVGVRFLVNIVDQAAQF